MRAALFRIVALGSIAYGLAAAHSEEKKEAETPSILIASPFALVSGLTNQVKLRGNHLTSITNISSSLLDVHASLGEAADAKPPDGLDAKIAGAQRLELSVSVPATLGETNVALILTTTNGVTLTNTFVVLPATTIDEREPNGGFRTAQKIPAICIVRGVIEPKKDVDVFRSEFTTNATVHIEIEAQRHGSVLDSILTIFDSQGRIRATNDDAKERDSALDFRPVLSGSYFIVVQDAHDRGGETHPYVLRLETPPGRD